jgi:hypothetical protein
MIKIYKKIFILYLQVILIIFENYNFFNRELKDKRNINYKEY